MRKSAYQTILLAGILAAILCFSSVEGAEPNLVSWWKFDEGSGTIAYDSAGGNNGTLVNGPIWTTGQINGALSFDGTNDYVDVGTSSSLKPPLPVTISAWIKLNTIGVTQQIMCIDDQSTRYYGIWFYVTTNNILSVGYGNGGLPGPSSRRGKDGTTALTSGQWYHVAAVLRGPTNMDLYINAVNNGGTYSGTGANLVYSSGKSLIGCNNSPANFLNGIIDDVRFYNRALSAGEVGQLYQEGLGSGRATLPNPANGATGIEPDVVLRWSPGKDATSHDVYFGTSFNDVNGANTSSPEYKGNFDVNNFDPCGLDYSATYYWRIDEVNDPNICKGDVWSFETARPTIALSATQFQFTAMVGGSNPADQVLGISNSGMGTLHWQINEGCEWLSVSPASGSSTGEVDNVNLSVDISDLSAGVYTCDLTISDPNATNNPQAVIVNLLVAKTAPIILCYQAETYGYVHATVWSYAEESDEQHDFSNNEKSEVDVRATAQYWQPCPPPQMSNFKIFTQRSDATISAEGGYDSNGVRLVARLNGFGHWSVFDMCGGYTPPRDDGGDGNGYTSITGTIIVGGIYNLGIPAKLNINGEVLGDVPGSWDGWQWQLKIWDEDVNNPLVLLNDSNTSASLDVLTGQILNMELHHEASSNFWPEGGLNSTVQINLNLQKADLDEDGDVDFIDYAILASQWLGAPGEPSADIAPPGGDSVIDTLDLSVFVDNWLTGSTSGPGIEFQISPCEMWMGAGSSGREPGQSDGTRFTVTVEGSNIHFEDMMSANCCTPIQNLWIEMAVNGNLITIYENEELPQNPCYCICDYPVTAALGPFEPGTYTFEVYNGGFVGSTTVVIE